MKSFTNFYISLLLSGKVITASETTESCPPKYTSLLPKCAIEQDGLATEKRNTCAQWETANEAVCPNLRPYLPHKFQMVKRDGKDVLRYSGGSANLPPSGAGGGGTYEIVGENDISFNTTFCNSRIPAVQRYYEDAVDCQESYQNIYKPGENNGIKGDEPAFSMATDSWAFYHATHKHWHASNIYEFTLHDVEFDPDTGKPTPSPRPLAASNKVTFCLIDYVAAVKNNGNLGNDNGENQLRYYWDCESHQSKLGISPGFLDQYHHALDGMDFDMDPFVNFLDVDACRDFFVVVTVNGECKYWESNYDDNVAYRGIRVCKKGNGKSFNWHVNVIGEESIQTLDGKNELHQYDSNTCCWDPEGKDHEMFQPHLCGEDISNK